MIETRKLTKRYGDLIAANQVDLKLDQGDVFGFIGPNGSGKTTTMRMLATLLNPDFGEAYVCGQSIYVNPKEIRRSIGYMPDFFGVYDDMKVIEYLEFFAAAYRINGTKRRQVCNEKLDLVDLDFKRDAYANTLSRGQTLAKAGAYAEAQACFLSGQERIHGLPGCQSLAGELQREWVALELRHLAGGLVHDLRLGVVPHRGHLRG